MFRIKPTRNQTTAKHTNLSPYPNNQLLVNPKKQPKIPNKFLLDQKDYKITQKPTGVNQHKNYQPNPKGFCNKNESSNQMTKTNQLLIKDRTQKPLQVSNPQKAIKQLANPTKNISLLSKNTNTPTIKQHERVLLKRSDNQRQHKLKIETVKKNQISSNLSKDNKNITTLKKQPLGSLIKRKQSARGKNLQKQVINNYEPNSQNRQDTLDYVKARGQQDKLNKEQNQQKKCNNQKELLTVPQIKAQIKALAKEYTFQQRLYIPQISKPPSEQQKANPFKSQKDQSPKHSSTDKKTNQISHKQEKQKNQQRDEEKNQKEKEMEELIIKIQKRREARQQEKKKLKQLQLKRKQNEQRAIQFLNSKNQSNPSQSQGVTGMLKLNDQLMHFSLAQTIMDLQIKKLLKTNFEQFPNKTQIKYQIDELERINLSYEMIRDDSNNPLRNGLQNYRVQIFNKIGDLIMQAQEAGYSNPNFHILEHDGRVGQGPNNPIPHAVRGLPQESYQKFIRFEDNDEEDECTICLGEIKLRQICAYVECGHKFHSSCIKEWVKTSANCPTCRFNIKFGHKIK